MFTLKDGSKVEDIPENYTGFLADSQCIQWWFLKGEDHRSVGPAVIWNDGDKYWKYKGLFHRTNGTAIEISEESPLYWCIQGFDINKKTKVVLICTI